ncbi:MAG TPA: hypothetical protein VII97_05070 [Anaerolineales bacterium]
MIIIDGFPGTMNAFDAPGCKGDRPQEDHILFKGQVTGFDGLGGAAQQDVEEGLFVIELTQDAIIQTFVFGTGEGMRIEAVLESIFIAARGTDLAMGFPFGVDVPFTLRVLRGDLRRVRCPLRG